LTGTPVAALIILYPGVNFKSVEGNGLRSQRDFRQERPNHCVEFVAVHPEIRRRIAQPDQAREERQCLFTVPVFGVFAQFIFRFIHDHRIAYVAAFFPRSDLAR
jgi:hypothetical protein